MNVKEKQYHVVVLMYLIATGSLFKLKDYMFLKTHVVGSLHFNKHNGTKSPQKSFIFITLPLQVSCMSCPQNWCLRLFVLSMLFRLNDCLLNTLESIK